MKEYGHRAKDVGSVLKKMWQNLKQFTYKSVSATCQKLGESDKEDFLHIPGRIHLCQILGFGTVVFRTSIYFRHLNHSVCQSLLILHRELHTSSNLSLALMLLKRWQRSAISSSIFLQIFDLELHVFFILLDRTVHVNLWTQIKEFSYKYFL